MARQLKQLLLYSDIAAINPFLINTLWKMILLSDVLHSSSSMDDVHALYYQLFDYFADFNFQRPDTIALQFVSLFARAVFMCLPRSSDYLPRIFSMALDDMTRAHLSFDGKYKVNNRHVICIFHILL